GFFIDGKFTGAVAPHRRKATWEQIVRARDGADPAWGKRCRFRRNSNAKQRFIISESPTDRRNRTFICRPLELHFSETGSLETPSSSEESRANRVDLAEFMEDAFHCNVSLR